MKKLISYFLLLDVFLIVFSCQFSEKKSKDLTTNKSEKPNIIYILADDLGYGDLSCYGQEKFKTPNIDKLASQGMLFTQHYSGSTVCAPSRSALLTGMHTGHTVIRGNKEIIPEGQYPIPNDTFTLGEQLQSAGYKTGAFGKWGLGYPGSEGDPINQGFDIFYGYNCQRLGHNYYPYHLWSNKDSIPLENNSGNLKGTYAPSLIHKKTLEFIEINKEKPFFLYVASIIPHAELVVPENKMKKYTGKFSPEKKYVGKENEPNYVRNGIYESQDEPRAAFAAMVYLLDEQVGELVDKVDELGLTDNTIIIFTSDNGPHVEGGADPEYFNSNGDLKGYKRALYEGGIRVPMIVKWPHKIQPGSVSNHISAFWDVFPTFSEIAGVSSPKNIDGISFLPELEGHINQQNKHEYLYWEFHEDGGRQAVRMGKWKGVKNGLLNNSSAPVLLFNLETDIGEENNVASENPKIIHQIEIILNKARTESDIFKFEQTAFDGKE